MGRQAAGEGFLKAFVEHSKSDKNYCYTNNQRTFEEFQNRVSGYGNTKDNVFIPFYALKELESVGTLYMPGPGIIEQAWSRRRFGQNSYSICGVTHTTASNTVMKTICDFMTAPVQEWDAVICTSKSVKATFEHIYATYGEYLKSRFGGKIKARPDMQLPIIPLGVDVPLLNVANKNDVRNSIRKSLNINDSDIVVLFMGRLSFHAKAHPMPMYQALEIAAKNCDKKFHLIQAGWFANEHIENAFKDGAARFCPSVKCHYLDGRNKKIRSEVWHAADIFCSLSDNIQETFGLTPVEAMAAGLPVVVSDWDGYKDTVRDSVDGYRIPTIMPPAGGGEDLSFRYENSIDNYDMYCANSCLSVSVDTQAAARAFVKLATNDSLRLKMGESAKKRAIEEYDWKVVVGKYEELWSELAKIRKSANETAKPVKGFHPVPMYDDPFALFATYPTSVLKPSDKITVIQGMSADNLKIFRMHPLNNFGIIIGYEAMEQLLIEIQASSKGGVKAGDLLKNDKFQKLGSNNLIRALIWMAKNNLITIERHNSVKNIDDGF